MLSASGRRSSRKKARLRGGEGSSRARYAGPDLTPMIDVVMQLLIFFMFASQFVSAMRTPVDLPKVRGEEAKRPPREQLVIDIRPDGGYVVNSEPIGLEALRELLVAEAAAGGGGTPGEGGVLVRADRSASASAVNVLAREAARAGVKTWRLGTAGE